MGILTSVFSCRNSSVEVSCSAGCLAFNVFLNVPLCNFKGRLDFINRSSQLLMKNAFGIRSVHTVKGYYIYIV